jgi:hypothetical protein
MTPDQLSAIRALHAQGYGIFGADLRALLDEVERLQRENIEYLCNLTSADLIRTDAFRRGAEAMRESAAQLVHQEVEGWMQLGLSGDIRALPIPKDE